MTAFTALPARLLLAAAVLFFCLALPAMADDAANIATFQSRYQAMHEAFQTRDRATMQAIFAEGFVSIDLNDQRMTAQQGIERILAAPKANGKDGATEVLSVVVSGDTAKVVQRYRTTGTKTSSDGRSHAMEMMARSTDTWIAADGVWRLQETRTDEMEMKADGIQIFRKMRDEN